MIQKLFDGVYRIDGKLATQNMVKGVRVYNEDLVEEDGKQYRLWNPYRSKLSAAIMNGLRELGIKKGSKVLYLGAATGTTPSHVSDIVGDKGLVFCIEISERSMRDLLKVCEVRKNLLPILEDARNTDKYSEDVGEVDTIYQDVAARDQDQILLRNAHMLKKDGLAYVAIKSQSIDVAKHPTLVFEDFKRSVSQVFEIVQEVDIEPYDSMHLFIVLRKR